jgi:hypothetical protein
VQGNIMDRRGEPIVGARVVVSLADQEHNEFANTEGAYAFSQLAEGEWNLRVDAQGYQTQALVVRVVGGSISWQHFALFGAGDDAGPGALIDGGQALDADLSPAPAPLEPPASCGCKALEFPGFLAFVSLFALARRRRRPGEYATAPHKETL